MPSAPVAADSAFTPELALACHLLSGQPGSWPASADAGFKRRILALCAKEGIEPLVHHALRSSRGSRQTGARAWPATVRDALAREARAQAALDMVREREVAVVLDALARAGIATLLLKGMPLAHSHYPAPALRTRCDTDLLVPPSDREASTRTLGRLGYLRASAVSGSLVSYQDCFRKCAGSVDHVVDLHWQVNNGQVFAQALRFDEIAARAVAVAALGPSARAPCAPHALLLACMHRAAHVGVDGAEDSRLIWLYDVHLLAAAMRADEWHEFARLCAAKRMRAVCRAAFAATAAAFGTAFPGHVLDRLQKPAAAELSAVYLAAKPRDVLLTDLRALATWKERTTLLWQLCFPAAGYVGAKYGAANRWLLPWWYARRAAEGVRKLVRRGA